MIKLFILYQILLISFCTGYAAECLQKTSLKINLFSSNNGKGLENSRQILKNALQNLGHKVYEKEFHSKIAPQQTQADINIFFEVLPPRWFNYANLNWFIPNPECYSQSLELLDGIDLVLCRTHDAEKIFQALGKTTYFLSFSSLDCYKPGVQKDYTSMLHMAGSSPFKGTNTVMETWIQNPLLPLLTILIHLPSQEHVDTSNLKYITSRLPLPDLRELQNRSGIHLCLSEAEGFGHYLMEAMSTEAVVITTNAPPMNEFIADERCLVNYSSSAPLNLATRYFVDKEDLAHALQCLLLLPPAELAKIGRLNRLKYEHITKTFHANLAKLLKRVSPARKSRINQ